MEQDDEFERLAESLNDRSEVFAFLTPGTLRVRCAYVRPNEKAPWWRFEQLVEQTRVQPVSDTARAGIADRPLVVWGSLRDLAALHAETDRPGVIALIHGARQVLAVGSAAISAAKSKGIA